MEQRDRSRISRVVTQQISHTDLRCHDLWPQRGSFFHHIESDLKLRVPGISNDKFQTPPVAVSKVFGDRSVDWFVRGNVDDHNRVRIEDACCLSLLNQTREINHRVQGRIGIRKWRGDAQSNSQCDGVVTGISSDHRRDPLNENRERDDQESAV